MDIDFARDTVTGYEKIRAAYSVSRLLQKLGVAKLVMVTNQVNYQYLYWGDSGTLERKHPMIPLSTTGITDSYGVLVPIDYEGSDVDIL